MAVTYKLTQNKVTGVKSRIKRWFNAKFGSKDPMREIEKQPVARKIKKMNKTFSKLGQFEAQWAVGFFNTEYKKRFEN